MLNFLLKKNVIWPVTGFGIGGLLWGLEAYRGTVGAGETFTNPFSYVLGAVAMAVFGGLALSYIKHLNGSPTVSRWLFSRQSLKIIGLGLIGWLAAFFVPAVWVEKLFSWSAVVISLPLSLLGENENLMQVIPAYFGLEPSLRVSTLFIEFLISGAVMGAVYAFILKNKILKTALWAGIGFALASLIGPIVGNLIGDLFGSLLISYLVTFLVIGKIFGFFLGRTFS